MNTTAPQRMARLHIISTADDRTLEYFYDDNGNVTKTIDNAGRETLTEYDTLNRPVRSVGPEHKSHIGVGHTNTRLVTKTTYNSLGYVTTLEAGYTTDLTGADTNDVLAIQAQYFYDDFGRLIEKHDANGKITRHIYDSHGNLIKTKSPNGHIVELEYDHTRNGLLTKRIAKRSTSDSDPHTTHYSYNALGQITRVTTPEVAYSYTYDKANRLTTVTDSRGNKTLTYDRSPGGLLNSIEDSEGKRSDFLYDATGRLTAILAPNGERVNFVFDAGGRLLETNIPGSISSHYSYVSNDYEASNQLRSLINRTAAGDISSQHEYTYDSMGRRDFYVETVEGITTDHNYAYDELNRLTQVVKYTNSTGNSSELSQHRLDRRNEGSHGLIDEYQYDQYGNRHMQRTSLNGTAPYYHYYQYDNAQQLQSVHQGTEDGPQITNFSYDDNGNLLRKNDRGVSRIFTYDALERLEKVEGSGMATETYQYDHKDRRVSKRVGGASQHYLYSGMSIWSEYGNDWGEALAHYTYTGLDQPIIRSTPNEADSRLYLHDGLGSAVAVSNTAGELMGSQRYDTWGNVTASTGVVPQYGYTGREPDASGLIYYRARYYDPGVGRFTQRDPIGFADGVNPYTYVGSSPANFVDPLGLAARMAGVFDGQRTAMLGARNSCMCHTSSFSSSPSEGDKLFQRGVSLLLDVPPLVGGVKSGQQFLTGQDYFAGESVSRGEEFAGIFFGMVGGKLISKYPEISKFGSDVVDYFTNRPFALGIDDHLDDFAKMHDATTWKQFDDVENWKPQVLKNILDPNQKVLFNLDGVDVWPGVSRSASGRGGNTDWELLQIRQNPQAWDTIEFWQGNSKVENPFQ